MNEREKFCHDLLVRQGYTVHRRGWPDFLVVRDGKGFAIEFKADRDRLSDEQRAMHADLARLGLLVRVWRENDVQAFKSAHLHGRLFVLPEHVREAKRELAALRAEIATIERRLASWESTIANSSAALTPAPPSPDEAARLEMRQAIEALPDLMSP